jgi:hypothetical protein
VLVDTPQAGGVAERESDWTMQSLCSAHLAEKHMWGAGIGFEDDVFLTNEEWITLCLRRSEISEEGGRGRCSRLVAAKYARS